jgi:hypothetical protein
MQPRLSYNNTKNVRVAAHDDTQVVDAEILFNVRISTTSGAIRQALLPVHVKSGEVIPPSTLIYEQRMRVLAQSTIDEIVERNTSYALHPMRGMFAPPLDGEELDRAVEERNRTGYEPREVVTDSDGVRRTYSRDAQLWAPVTDEPIGDVYFEEGDTVLFDAGGGQFATALVTQRVADLGGGRPGFQGIDSQTGMETYGFEDSVVDVLPGDKDVKVSHRRAQNVGDNSDEIIDAMARAFFVSAWADAQEEAGESFSGMELMDVAPETPNEAYDFAFEKFQEIEAANAGLNLGSFLPPGEEEGAFDVNEFGHYLAMESMGHGVGWSDSHEDHGLNIPFSAGMESDLAFAVEGSRTAQDFDKKNWDVGGRPTTENSDGLLEEKGHDPKGLDPSYKRDLPAEPVRKKKRDEDKAYSDKMKHQREQDEKSGKESQRLMAKMDSTQRHWYEVYLSEGDDYRTAFVKAMELSRKDAQYRKEAAAPRGHGAGYSAISTRGHHSSGSEAAVGGFSAGRERGVHPRRCVFCASPR